MARYSSYLLYISQFCLLNNNIIRGYTKDDSANNGGERHNFISCKESSSGTLNYYFPFSKFMDFYSLNMAN